jgi:hypothetical protein
VYLGPRGSTYRSRRNHSLPSLGDKKKPDIVIVDQKSKSVNSFELTVPGESRLDTAHTLKMESYSHFTIDIRTQTVTGTPFEVEAHTGRINQDNKKRLHSWHTCCTKDVKLKLFKAHISQCIIYSYFLLYLQF